MKHIFSKQTRALLSELVRTDFKLRYQGSVLGYAWSLLRPLMIFLILYVVFVKFLKIGSGVEHYPIYLLLGIVLWNFFAEMTTTSLSSIVSRGDLIRKIKIPRWTIVLSSSFSALINLSLNLLVVGVFMIFNDVDLLKTGLIFPFILLEIYIFALGMSLILATLFVKLRDINYIWEVSIQALFYLTPILYPITLITNDTFRNLLFLNPMAQSIQDARYSLVTHESFTIYDSIGSPLLSLVPHFLVLVVIVVGIVYFRSQSKHFAEEV